MVRPNFSDITGSYKKEAKAKNSMTHSGRLYYRANARPITQLLVYDFDRIHIFG
jgi:hypothetical protein